MKLSLHLKLPSSRSWLRLIPFGTLVVLFVVLAICVVFLYQEFYQTIAQAKVVYILQSQISLSRVDVPLYQSIFQNLEEKKKSNPALLQNLPNPFNPPTTPGNPGGGSTGPSPASP